MHEVFYHKECLWDSSKNETWSDWAKIGFRWRLRRGVWGRGRCGKGGCQE